MKLVITSEDAGLIASILSGRRLSTEEAGLLKKMEEAVALSVKVEELRRHPAALDGPYAEQLREGSRILRICPGCPSLVAWPKGTDEKCVRCGAGFREVEDAFPEQYERIKQDLDETWKVLSDRKAIEKAYPKPVFDGAFTPCKVCRAPVPERVNIGSWESMVCGPACFFKFVGREKPRDRSWSGFMHLNPHSKGSVVRYLGAFSFPQYGDYTKSRIGECYLWRFDNLDRYGTLYAYFSEGSEWNKDYLCAAAKTSEDDWQGVRKAVEADLGQDESWRVAANAVERW